MKLLTKPSKWIRSTQGKEKQPMIFSLPGEVLSNIVSHMPLSDIRNFSSTCKSAHKVGQAGLWRSMTIRDPYERYSVTPILYDYPDKLLDMLLAVNRDEEWQSIRARKAWSRLTHPSMAHCVSYVRSLAIHVRSSQPACGFLRDLLTLVAPSLTKLEITMYHFKDDDLNLKEYERFFESFLELRNGNNLGNLTTLRLTIDTWMPPSGIIDIIEACPVLAVLDLTVTAARKPRPSLGTPASSDDNSDPKVTRRILPNLQSLFLALPGYFPFEFRELLQRVPNLHTFGLRPISTFFLMLFDIDDIVDVLFLLSDLPELKYLDWRAGPSQCFCGFQKTVRMFQKLEELRIIHCKINPSSWRPEDIAIPIMPRLRTLVTMSPYLDINVVHYSPTDHETSLIQEMSPALVDTLEATPTLQKLVMTTEISVPFVHWAFDWTRPAIDHMYRFEGHICRDEPRGRISLSFRSDAIPGTTVTRPCYREAEKPVSQMLIGYVGESEKEWGKYW